MFGAVVAVCSTSSALPPKYRITAGVVARGFSTHQPSSVAPFVRIHALCRVLLPQLGIIRSREEDRALLAEVQERADHREAASAEQQEREHGSQGGAHRESKDTRESNYRARSPWRIVPVWPMLSQYNICDYVR